MCVKIEKHDVGFKVVQSNADGHGGDTQAFPETI